MSLYGGTMDSFLSKMSILGGWGEYPTMMVMSQKAEFTITRGHTKLLGFLARYFKSTLLRLHLRDPTESRLWLTSRLLPDDPNVRWFQVFSTAKFDILHKHEKLKMMVTFKWNLRAHWWEKEIRELSFIICTTWLNSAIHASL